MNEKRYYWLKLKEDFFSSKRIKKIRSIAGGDTYTIIYLKMLLKALKNDGYLYFDGVMNDFAEEIALDIDEKPDDVKVTIQLLSSVGLMEHSEETDVYKLTYMDIMIGSETAHTQRQRDYIRRKKEREASLNDASVTPLLQVGDAEKEIEKEIELEIEKELEIDKGAKPDRKVIPPTLDMVKDYCWKRGNTVDPESFFNFYESKGWYIGKSKMKDWQAAVRTWEGNGRSNQRKSPNEEVSVWDKWENA